MSIYHVLATRKDWALGKEKENRAAALVKSTFILWGGEQVPGSSSKTREKKKVGQDQELKSEGGGGEATGP